MPPSSPSIEEFGLDIQKWMSLEQAKTDLLRNTLKKMQVSKATSSIMRLFALLDIHYDSSLNINVQKQNEIEIKKLKIKFIDSMIFGIHWNNWNKFYQ